MSHKFDMDKDAKLDFAVDWAPWLADDTMSVSTWEAEEGITVDSDSMSATAATVWLSGGTVGQRYRITNHIVTAAGRENDLTISIRVQEQ